MNKEQRRFSQGAEEVEVVFVPQCNSCKLNINRLTCKQFPEGKPNHYIKNELECPYKQKK